MGISEEIDDATIAVDETTIWRLNRQFDLQDFSEVMNRLTSTFGKSSFDN